MQYLSVADNAREALFLHISASSERQEWGNKTGVIIKTKKQRTLTHSDASGHSILCFYTAEQLVSKLNNTLRHRLY
jgi:hypothetical protein